MTEQIKEKLLSFKDKNYKLFTAKLIPNISADNIIGVRTPVLKKLAKELKKDKNIDLFLNDLPHKFHEENLLHAFLINETDDFEDCISQLDQFLPYVDNWAVCDGIRPKNFKKNTEKLLPQIEKWLCSGKTYTIRFAIECLMCFYLDQHFDEKYPAKVAKIVSDEYYVNMMIAWYFATALAKQWNSTVKHIEQTKMSRFVHNKAIQKAVESYRINDEQKAYLKTLKK